MVVINNIKLLLFLGLFPYSGFSQISFVDVTISSGLKVADSTANQLGRDEGFDGPYSWGHRIIWADIDGDELPDLFVGRWPNILLHNNGDGTFNDISKSSGYRQLKDKGHGAVVFDMDNDGDRDWFANGNKHYTNIDVDVLASTDGSGNFTSVLTSSTALFGLPGSISLGTRGVGAADFDGDGYVDLVAVSWSEIDGDNTIGPSNDHVFWNDGTGRYLTATTLSADGNNQGVQTIDFDGDGDIDIYTNVRDSPNQLYRNDGNRIFTEVASIAGIALDNKESDDGATWGDIDNDGDLDFACGGEVYKNSDGVFTKVSTFPNYDGYMMVFGDLDNDGYLDLVIPGNEASFNRNKGALEVYVNDGDGGFTIVKTTGLLPPKGDRRGVAFSDFDGDGRLDLGISDKRDFNSLFKNTTANVGNWLKVKLYRANGQIDAIGSFVYVYSEGHIGEPSALIGVRFAEGATGYSAQNDPVLHFGLAGHNTVDVRVKFPQGDVTDILNVHVNKRITVVEKIASSSNFEPK